MKVLNGINLLPVAAFFLPRPAQYLAGIVPTYWPMRALWSAAQGDRYFVYLVVGTVAGLLSVVLVARVFEQRLLTRPG